MSEELKKEAKKEVKPAVEITDILEERFKDEDGVMKVKRTFLAGKKKVGEEVVND